MTDIRIAAIVYADGVYPDQPIARAIAPLRERGIRLAGAIQLDPADRPGRHPCDLLLENLATGEVTPIAEERGKTARGCRLDIGVLTEIADAVTSSLHDGTPQLLIVNKFGKVEADGGGMREAIAEAVALGIPALVGVPARNLDSWRAFAKGFSVEVPADADAIEAWFNRQGVLATAVRPSLAPVQPAPRE